MWSLGSIMWSLGSIMWSLGSIMWSLGSIMWWLGSIVWSLGSIAWSLGSIAWSLGSAYHRVTLSPCHLVILSPCHKPRSDSMPDPGWVRQQAAVSLERLWPRLEACFRERATARPEEWRAFEARLR